MSPHLDDLIGKPFKLGGRGPDAFDCWGLVREVMQRMRPGLALPDWASDGIARDDQRAIMAGACPVYCEPVDGMPDGALLVSEFAGHIAIVVGHWVITARRFGGVVALRPRDYAQQLPDLRAYTWRA